MGKSLPSRFSFALGSSSPAATILSDSAGWQRAGGSCLTAGSGTSTIAAARTRRGAEIDRTRPTTMGSLLSFRDWIDVASLMLMLSANACAISPAPQVTAPPPGQARIWFYRLWDPSESVNLANIDMNGVYVGSVEPGGAFYRDVAPGAYHIVPQNRYIDHNQNTNVAVVPGEQVFIAVLDLSS